MSIKKNRRADKKFSDHSRFVCVGGASLRRAGRSALLLALSLVLAVLPVAEVSASKVTDLQNQKAQTQSQLTQAQNEADVLEEEIQDVSNAIDETNEQIVQIMAGIEILEGEIAELDQQIEKTQAEYDAAKAEEDRQYEAMKRRIKYIYEKGDADYVQIILQSTSFSDILNKTQYANQLAEYDQNMIVRYQEVQKKVAEKQAQLEDEKAEREENRLGLEEEQNALEVELNILREQYEDIDERIAVAQQQAAIFAQQLIEQTNALAAAIEEEARIAAEKRRQEEEARRKAEEEARRKAEQEAQSASGTSTASSQTSTTSASTAQTKVYASPSGKTGQDVVNYACQFVGNPYVYGGNSLTNGTDCSGFTSLVYKAFGYSLARTDVGQRSNGIAVASLEEALPGDIICYPGHVAIYCGNGTIVHASTARTGIKYSNVNYRQYICIRRIIY